MNKNVLLLSLALLGGSTAMAFASPASVVASRNPVAAVAAEVAGLTGRAKTVALNNLIQQIAAMPATTAAGRAAKADAVAAALGAYDAGTSPSTAAQNAATSTADAAGGTAATGGNTGGAAGGNQGSGN